MMSTPLRAGRLEHFVHPRRHLRDAQGRVGAGVRVPHVADDDRRLLRLPRVGLGNGMVLPGFRRRFLAGAQVQLQSFAAGIVHEREQKAQAQRQERSEGHSHSPSSKIKISRTLK